MALTYRFYRAQRIGTGSRPGDAYRSALCNYIVEDGSGANLWDWIHDARPLRYGLARADSTVHATIDGDTTITALSVQLSDVSAVNTWLNGTLQSLPAAVTTLLETDGLSIAWTTPQTTRLDMWRYIGRVHAHTRELWGLQNNAAMALFQSGLDSTLSSLTANQRTAVNAWVTSHGLDPSTMTTVRQVIQSLTDNRQWPTISLGPVGL